MKLDIIVPHYKEPWEVCKYLFTTIATQRMVNFNNIRVILVNDGNDVVFDEDKFNDFPFKVNYIVKEHVGVSAARNCGLDNSDADYVMFCDSDDGFLSNVALYMIYLEAKKNYNIINPIFLEEWCDGRTGEKRLASHQSDATFLHGKAYNRKFLVEHDIRFPDGYDLHEDGHFNAIAICSGQDNCCELNAPLYVWCWNENSVVRKEFDFTLRTYDKLIDVWRLTLKWLKDHGLEDERKNVLAKTVIYTYYHFQTPAFTAAHNAKYLKAAERAFKKFYLEIRNEFLRTDQMVVAKLSDILREEVRENGLLIEEISLKAWLRHIEYEVKG